MATPNVGILTTAGKALIDKINAGQAKITFSKIVFSSMDNSQLSDDQIKALTAITPQEVVVNSPEVTLDDNTGETRIRATGTNESLTSGVYVKTYAVFAKDDGDNEILYGVTIAPKPNYLPEYDGVTPQAVTYSYKVALNNTDNVTFTNSDDVYVSETDLDAALQSYANKVVHKTGDEEIAGTKTFDTAPIDKNGDAYITGKGIPSNIATLDDVNKKVTDNGDGTITVNGKTYTPADDSKVVHSVTGDTTQEVIHGPKKFEMTPSSPDGYSYQNSNDLNNAITNTAQFINGQYQFKKDPTNSQGNPYITKDGVPQFWNGTQAEFNNITTKDDNTYYYILEGNTN
ncbi:hypothetical protein YK48G_03820 [Lentilactobacillus fungorum]|uniref:Minor tail protein gp31 C-terminal domain-containing protein n=1 Tax=Lentilactobacillus fungorum TaxID=2201250 RepID=A0ABQ3VXD0_9LACO|nr:hypothetical protein [Lentilactobacillus fungorum]GHP12957.1 hypothetical protein YK48G_03820 [Lentilactobacillus fungorum]